MTGTPVAVHQHPMGGGGTRQQGFQAPGFREPTPAERGPNPQNPGALPFFFPFFPTNPHCFRAKEGYRGPSAPTPNRASPPTPTSFVGLPLRARWATRGFVSTIQDFGQGPFGWPGLYPVAGRFVGFSSDKTEGFAFQGLLGGVLRPVSEKKKNFVFWPGGGQGRFFAGRDSSGEIFHGPRNTFVRPRQRFPGTGGRQRGGPVPPAGKVASVDPQLDVSRRTGGTGAGENLGFPRRPLDSLRNSGTPPRTSSRGARVAQPRRKGQAPTLKRHV